MVVQCKVKVNVVQGAKSYAVVVLAVVLLDCSVSMVEAVTVAIVIVAIVSCSYFYWCINSYNSYYKMDNDTIYTTHSE